ncbi:MAG: hypothetical protein QW183_07080, partial [Saccharolobus sp.]
MYSPLYILYLAMTIDSLTYSLGALLYGSPIPIYSIKRLGQKMITDAIQVAIWANLFYFIINLINQIQSYVGANWNVFYSVGYLLELQLSIYINAFKTLYTVLDTVISYFRLNIIFSPLILPLLQYATFLTDLAMLLSFYIDLGILIQSAYEIFISIGILLMALPFRIGKGIGSLLISSTIIFYIGLPILPLLILSAAPTNLNTLLSEYFSLGEQIVIADIPLLVYAYIVLPVIYISILAGFSAILSSFLSGYA